MALAEQAGQGLSELVAERVQITNAPIPSTGANPAGLVHIGAPDPHADPGLPGIVVKRGVQR